MPSYLFWPTGHFSEKLSMIKKNDPNGYDRIVAVIDRILSNPGSADGRMHGPHRDKFKKYVGRRDYRLIYYWCELCRKANRRLKEVCEGCETVPEHSVIFFDVYHKNESRKDQF